MPRRQWPCKQGAWASQLSATLMLVLIESFKVHEVKPHYSEESVQVEENVLIPRLRDGDQVHVALNLVE